MKEEKMSDQCGKCELRNNVDGCLREDCWQHDNWLVFALDEQRNFLRAQLAEAQKEIERLKKHACEYSAVDNAIINPCGFVMKLLEKFEQAGAENASLRERLKKVEEVYKMRDPSVSQMWQAIKNASAETDEK